MASLPASIYYLLANDATVSGIVGSYGGVTAQRLPRSVSFPAVSFQIVSGVRDHYQASDGGAVYGGFQVSCWDRDYVDTVALAAAVRGLLSRYSGTVQSLVIDDVRLENEIHRWHEGVENERGLNEILLDFVVYFKE